MTLKEKQMQILRTVIVEKKDVLAVLPTGFSKSTDLWHPSQISWKLASGRQNISIVLVVSPLNALVRDQVTELRVWFESV